MICLSTDTDQEPPETAVCVVVTYLYARVMICLSTDTDQEPSETAVCVIVTDLQARVMTCLFTDTDQWPSETAICAIVTDLQARVMFCLFADTDQWPSETPVCCYCSKIPRPRLKTLHVHRHCPVTSRESACLSTLTCGHLKCCPPPPTSPHHPCEKKVQGLLIKGHHRNLSSAEGGVDQIISKALSKK